MKRLSLLALALLACGTTPQRVPAGEFTGPSGLTVTSAGDRDLLFVANEGRDNLRALQMCTNAIPDGGTDPCPTNEDFQFVPAPIRVFPATIETGDRPRRLAGVRLTRPALPGQTEARTGVVLAVGADNNLRIVDARNLVETVQGKAAAAPVLSLPLPAPAADVVAENLLDASGMEISRPAGQPATAFVATVAQGSIPAQLLMLSVDVDEKGAARVPTITGQCSLGDVLPRKLAVVPGGGDRVYVADGAGDGVVSVTKASMSAPANPPAPCVVDRIGAGGRAARSVAVSPAWLDTAGAPHAAGELLILLLEPLPSATGGLELDPGGILIARTADKSIVPVPPFGLFDQTSSADAGTDGGVATDGGVDAGPVPTPMEPMSTPALPREVTFLRATPSDPVVCPNPPPAGTTPGACTLLYVGVPDSAPVARFNLLAAVTSTDGAAYFLDVVNRRFVTTSTYTGLIDPLFGVASLVGAGDPSVLSLVPAVADDTHPIPGWLTSGVTKSNPWRALFHAPMPALEARSGTLTVAGNGNYQLKLPGLNLQIWVIDPALKLAPGDAVSFNNYQAPAGSPQPCADLVNLENGSPARFELSILSIPAPDTVELAPFQATGDARPFNLSACPSGLGVVASVRAVGDHPWLVYENSTVRGRAKNGENFVATGRRFDYPLNYSPASPPGPSDNTELAFLISGNDPPYSGNVITGFTFSLDKGLEYVPMRDQSPGGGTGVATTVMSYSSPRHPLLVFTALTGGNTLLQADPSVLLSQPFGVVAYK